MPEVDTNGLRMESATVLSMARAKALQNMAADKPGAIQEVVRVEQALGKLYGLDAPSEVIVHTPTQTELDNWVNSMVRATMPTVEQADPDDLLGIAAPIETVAIEA